MSDHRRIPMGRAITSRVIVDRLATTNLMVAISFRTAAAIPTINVRSGA
jgi:hypothetical protein